MFDGSYMRLTIDKWGSVSKCINTTSEIKSFVNILINKNSSMINNDDNENDTAGDDEYLKNYSMVEYTLWFTKKEMEYLIPRTNDVSVR